MEFEILIWFFRYFSLDFQIKDRLAMMFQILLFISIYLFSNLVLAYLDINKTNHSNICME